MTRSLRTLSLALGLTLSLAAPAVSAQTATVQVSDAWVRATVPQQKATGAFMTLQAPAGTRLVEARSPVAAVVEIHEMAMQGDVMRMRAVPGIDLPAGKAVALKPGGHHVMLIDLKQALKAGDSVPLTLVFEGADKQRTTQSVQAPVRALNAPAAAPMGGHDHGGHKH
jgi:copper(I)-binding protein